jgi:excisionase family DNA binding protein
MSRAQRKSPVPIAIGNTGGGGGAGAEAIIPAAPPTVNVGPDRLTYRIGEVASMLGLSRRTIERELSAGRFPKPDVRVGKSPLWSRETLTRWIAGGGR